MILFINYHIASSLHNESAVVLSDVTNNDIEKW